MPRKAKLAVEIAFRLAPEAEYVLRQRAAQLGTTDAEFVRLVVSRHLARGGRRAAAERTMAGLACGEGLAAALVADRQGVDEREALTHAGRLAEDRVAETVRKAR